jgi:hypothetical protein
VWLPNYKHLATVSYCVGHSVIELTAFSQIGFCSVALSSWEPWGAGALGECSVCESSIPTCLHGYGGESSLQSACGNGLLLIFGRCRSGCPSFLLSRSDFKAFVRSLDLYRFEATSLPAMIASAFMAMFT